MSNIQKGKKWFLVQFFSPMQEVAVSTTSQQTPYITAKGMIIPAYR